MLVPAGLDSLRWPENACQGHQESRVHGMADSRTMSSRHLGSNEKRGNLEPDCLSYFEPPAGIDPATSFLPRTRSTTELRGQQVNTLHRFLRFAKSVGDLLLRSQYSYSSREWATRNRCDHAGCRDPGSRPGFQLPRIGAVPAPMVDRVHSSTVFARGSGVGNRAEVRECRVGISAGWPSVEVREILSRTPGGIRD